MEIITKDALNDYVLKSLQAEAKAVFGSKFKDLNETGNGTKLRLYLTSVDLGDEAKYDTVLSSHNPSQIRAAATTEKSSRRGRKQAALAKIGLITPDEIKGFFEAIADGNDD